MRFLVTGDIHGKIDYLHFLKYEKPESTALIVLGDFGFNFNFDKNESLKKTNINSWKNYIYVVRGNHEERPELCNGIKSIYDKNVKGEVWCDPIKYPYIRYLKDGGIYEINGHSVLAIGGAYSIDKNYRQIMNWPWFSNEQLSQEEMNKIFDENKGKSFDFILTHTCPYSWQPFDLFLPGIDQSTVDNSMEKWFDEFKNNVNYKVWLFGHFHQDRFVRPHVEMMYHGCSNIEEIFNRWNGNEKIKEDEFVFDTRYDADDNLWRNTFEMKGR